MTPVEWTGMGLGIAVAAALLALARLGLRGGALRGRREYRFECPRFHEDVACRVLQNVRTGQWSEVETCTAFAEPEKVLCERECARVANLGLLRARA